MGNKYIRIAAGAMILIIVLFCVFHESLLYYEGRSGWHFTSFIVIGIYVAGVSCAAILLLAFYRATRQRAYSLVTAILILLALTWASALMFHNPGYIAFLEGFEGRVAPRMEAEIENVRTWALRLLASRTESYYHVPDAEVPKSVKELSKVPNVPSTTIFTATRTGLRFVGFEFGGGFGHYGFLIGPTTNNITSDEGIYIRPWRKGVWFYHSKQ